MESQKGCSGMFEPAGMSPLMWPCMWAYGWLWGIDEKQTSAEILSFPAQIKALRPNLIGMHLLLWACRGFLVTLTKMCFLFQDLHNFCVEEQLL